MVLYVTDGRQSIAFASGGQLKSAFHLRGQIGQSVQNGPYSDLIQIFRLETFTNAERFAFHLNNLNGLIVLTV